MLARYASAYERLDANAAREVWPSVDHGALARAFENLESQDLQFDNCRLAVTGSRATAACTGIARYVRRVGNRSSRIEARQWTFNLRREADTWQIDAVRVR